MILSFRRLDFFPIVKQGFRVVIKPTTQRDQLARSESSTGRGRFDDGLVSPTPRNALGLTVRAFYEIILIIPFPQSLPDRYVLPT